MKKLLLSMLALASVQPLLAQLEKTKTETIFSSTVPPGKSDIRFDFQLGSGNKMILEFSFIDQLDALPDIDSLLKQVWTDLQNFEDSLNTPLANKRVDYVIAATDRKIRILQYPQQGSSYSIRDGNITQLKIEQDTLRIRLSTPKATKIIGRDGTIAEDYPYYITLLLNDITALPEVLNSLSILPAIDLLKSDLATYRKRKYFNPHFYAKYDISNGRTPTPATDLLLRYESRWFWRSRPFIQIGFQHLNGGWCASSGMGWQFIARPDADHEDVYRLFLEGYVFFNRDASGLTAERNGFVTFKYSGYSRVDRLGKKVQFAQNISLGYLIHREGPWFAERSIKLSAMGLQNKSLLLEPEFVFNLKKKNYGAPSLKLTYFLF